MRSAFGIVHKSYVGGGVFKPVTALTGAERKAVRGGGLYRKAQGVTKPDRAFKKTYRQNVKAIGDIKRKPLTGGHELAANAGYMGPLEAATLRVGSKSSGHGVILTPGKRARPDQMHHEMQHALPRRSAYRMHQIKQSAEGSLREEARADYLSTGHYNRKSNTGGYGSMARMRDAAVSRPKKKVSGSNYDDLRSLGAPKKKLKKVTNKMAFKAVSQNASRTGGAMTGYKFNGKTTDAYRSLHNTLKSKGVKEGPYAKGKHKY